MRYVVKKPNISELHPGVESEDLFWIYDQFEREYTIGLPTAYEAKLVADMWNEEEKGVLH
jgi:hypothetical protein